MDQELTNLSPDQCLVVQAVSGLQHSSIEVPRPYTLRMIAGLAGISQRRIQRGLRSLQLMDVLSDKPDQALRRVEALEPLAWKIVEI
jgi:hypothetical protein